MAFTNSRFPSTTRTFSGVKSKSRSIGSNTKLMCARVCHFIGFKKKQTKQTKKKTKTKTNQTLIHHKLISHTPVIQRIHDQALGGCSSPHAPRGRELHGLGAELHCRAPRAEVALHGSVCEGKFVCLFVC